MSAAKFPQGGVASGLWPQGAPQRPSTSPQMRATRAARPRPGRGTPGRVPRGPPRPRRCRRVPHPRPAPRQRTLSRHPLPRPARQAPGLCQRLARAGSVSAERSGQPRPLRRPPRGPAGAAAAAGDVPTHFMQHVSSWGPERTVKDTWRYKYQYQALKPWTCDVAMGTSDDLQAASQDLETLPPHMYTAYTVPGPGAWGLIFRA